MRNSEEALKQILGFYERYYNINTEDPMSPFSAEAVFSTHDEHYLLIRSAKITEMDSEEFVFFALTDHLTLEEAKTLDETAWQEGLSRASVKPNHKSSDVAVVIIAEKADEEAFDFIRKAYHFKNYRFGLWGYSSYRIGAIELAGGKTACNRQGRELQKLFAGYMKKIEGRC